jgi:aminoglycoside phosphotransferase (APT) family kinase protein
MRTQLELWLRDRMPGATISELIVPSSNGMSSETVLFDVCVLGEEEASQLVARVAPDPAADPVFPHYDMGRQFATMRLVAEHTRVPVPRVQWLEEDPTPIGAPFFVMDRAKGLVPPDVLPYTFGNNWLFDAARQDQDRLQLRTIEVLAELHRMSAKGPARFLSTSAAGRSDLQQHVHEQRGYYEWVAGDGIRSPLIERGFSWLEDHWPEEEGPSALSWGDSRIGNIMFEDFKPVAVLDWEMASLGPREVDLGWLIYFHQFLHDMAQDFGLPGMPHAFLSDDVTSQYGALTGHSPRDVNFYITYAALRHAIVTFRMARRQATFGEADMPQDPDDAVMYQAHFRELLDGTYRSSAL